MDLTPPSEETPKDYATRRIDDIEQPVSASENTTPNAEEKSRTRKTPAQPVTATEILPADNVPVVDQPLPPPPLPASPPALPGLTPKNESIWIAVIIGICIVALACICSCTIVAAVFLNNPPW
jgi:hypothetical protein